MIKKLPAFFAPLFWSSDFTKIDPEKHKLLVILQTVNFGNLRHFRWLVNTFGRQTIRSVLEKRYETEFRPGIRRLVSLLFGVKGFIHGPRRAA
ncbi:MAG: hypothetical protein Q8R11_01530 [bacterium]|nr:hypothetical protein [bacterium]